MKYKIIFLFCILVSCNPGQEQAPDNIAVHWELITNFTDEPNVFEARFELTNNGNRSLTDKNWTLFFNMAPRPILEPRNPEPAALQHINGDWYKLKPNAGFKLEPGQSVAVQYRGMEGVIKETDRPLGLYVVYYDSEGREEKIVEVSDYSWSPFSRPEQINRSKDDAEPIPTPEWNYKNNLALHPVPDREWKAVIPSPVSIRTSTDSLRVSSAMAIYHPAGLENEANYLASALCDLTGERFRVVTKPSGEKQIRLSLNNTVAGKESYQLKVEANGIAITGSDPAGIFYGIQSLRALIPLRVYQKKRSAFLVPFASIQDTPRFAFRGVHLDVSRNFQTKETVLRMLDLLSFYKINRFLLYTTEDEGWRLEIKGLPELTRAGAQREHTYGKEAPVLHPAYGSGPFARQEGKFGHGFYSRQDFIEILKYAKARHIRVIPELNFPGHARAAIKAMEARYQRLIEEGKEAEANEYRLIDPDDASEYISAQGYKDNVVCVARESAFRFYEKVVDEIAGMYSEAGLTLEEFHTGGDEVPEGAWTKSPLASALLRQHPEIGDPKNLQTWFFRELVQRLKKRKLQVHGWEETVLVKTQNGYVPNPEFVNEKVVPYIWNNLFDYPDLGYRLANAGYAVVLCNVSNFYFDLAYSKDPLEPGLYWAGFVNPRHAWTFAPYDMFKNTTKNNLGQILDVETAGNGAVEKSRILVEPLKKEARKNILGVEAQLWSETIKGRDMLEYYMLPKLIGFAESAWAAERAWETIENKSDRGREIDKTWNVFANTLARKELPRIRYLNGGYNYRVPPPGAVIEKDTLKANVEYPGLVIRYTTDRTEPTERSGLYRSHVKVNGPVRLKSFDASGKSSRTIEVQ